MNLEPDNLQQGFAQFMRSARELEASYASLKLRADVVDVRLQQSNRALQQSLDEREAMFAALPIGVMALRSDGSNASGNREATRLIDAAQEAGIDLVASPVGEVAFGDYRVRVRRVDLPDGELVMLEDRSRLEELEAEVLRLDRLAGLSELALGVAHEIKNPLNGVLGFANLLEVSRDPVAMKRYASKVAEGVRAVDQIVKSMLGFARPAGKAGRVATVRQLVERVARDAGLPETRWSLRGRSDCCVDADAVTRVLANLVQNAIEARSDVSLWIDAERVGDAVTLLVRDDGPGVSASIAGNVLEPFVSTKQRGSGLGLALCARVLSFLGGELELTNPGQRGACFRVRVPVIASGSVMREAHA